MHISCRFLQPCERNVNRNYYYGFASPDEHKAYDGSLRFDDCNFFDARKTTPPPPSKSTLQSYYKSIFTTNLKTLHSLELVYDFNLLDSDGALLPCFVQLLENTKCLRYLKLQRCYFSSQNLSELFSILGNVDQLESFTCTGTHIRDESVDALQRMLARVRKLTFLDLYDAGLVNESIAVLADGLRVNRSLKTVQLGGQTSVSVWRPILQAVLYNPTLTSVSLHNSGVGSDGFTERIKRGIQFNAELWVRFKAVFLGYRQASSVFSQLNSDILLEFIYFSKLLFIETMDK